jgi:Putative beta barrel porin-7 (BBP7)
MRGLSCAYPVGHLHGAALNRYMLCCWAWGCFVVSLGAWADDETDYADPPPRTQRSESRRSAAPPRSSVRATPVRTNARQASWDEGSPAFDDPYPGDNGWEGGGCGPGGCGSGGCGPGGCGLCGPEGCNYNCYPGCRLIGSVYGDVDYLMWWTQGMRIPPLVITNPNVGGNAQQAVDSARNLLDLNPANTSTQILYGNQSILDGMRSGARARVGVWLGPNGCNALEGEYFGLGDIHNRFVATSPGNPALGRPFFDADPNPLLADRFRSEIVALPNNVAGTVAVDSLGRFTGVGARFRRNLMCEQTCCDDWCGCPVQGMRKVDGIFGWRYVKFDEELNIQENLQTLPGNALRQPVGTFQVNDRFHTFNNFNGVDFGVLWQGRRGCWSLDLTTKISLGVMHQRAIIFGQTMRTPQGQATETATGGLLAQTTNIGDRSRDVFAVVPEAGVNLGYQVTPRVKAVFGYTFMYLSNVVRPGEIIDTTVDSRLLAFSGQNANGATRPQFRWVDSDLWVQGMNFGLHFDF